MLKALSHALNYEAHLLTGGAGGTDRTIIVRVARSGTRRIVVVSRSATSPRDNRLTNETRVCHCVGASTTTMLKNTRSGLHAAGML